MQQLRKIDISGSPLGVLPRGLGTLANLTELSLSCEHLRFRHGLQVIDSDHCLTLTLVLKSRRTKGSYHIKQISCAIHDLRALLGPWSPCLLQVTQHFTRYADSTHIPNAILNVYCNLLLNSWRLLASCRFQQICPWSQPRGSSPGH